MDIPDQIAILSSDSVPIEERLLQSGVGVVCGVDEAGRGPLAGPVVAAAAVYRDCEVMRDCADSKLLSPKRRAELYEAIRQQLVIGVGRCSPAEIDRWNIRQASLRAMVRAVDALACVPDLALVDGRDRLPCDLQSTSIVHGDAKVACIGAASIVAKVTRDRLMTEMDRRYPEYGFARHFGYPTAEHRRMLQLHGPCFIHRRSFRGVRELVEET